MHSAKLVWITPDAEKLVGKIARSIGDILDDEVPTIARAMWG